MNHLPSIIQKNTRTTRIRSLIHMKAHRPATTAIDQPSLTPTSVKQLIQIEKKWISSGLRPFPSTAS